MRWLRKTALLMIGVLAVSGCTIGGSKRPERPQLCPAPLTPELRPLPVEMLSTPNFEQRALQRGFRTEPSQTFGSDSSSEN
ncbi:hypothetical protein SAMN06296058_0696 [Pseudoxanthomonas indica]|uniref:Uncharacterized protein n=1 Tax=Pseudoxanthomonas indica TaxID=428993 RepID=A0A1T5JCY2_9GAMM|nr:hypothetical protein SAMN06296058_0696 [Pseudoxanthomonas indica]